MINAFEAALQQKREAHAEREAEQEPPTFEVGGVYRADSAQRAPHWLALEVTPTAVIAVRVTKAEGRRWLDGTGTGTLADYDDAREFARENIASWERVR